MPRQFCIAIADRNYTDWDVSDSISCNKQLHNFNPLESKLLHHDLFTWCPNTGTTIVSSRNRTDSLPGVIILSKTYGSYKERFLYKCQPHNKHLPEFLLPYKIPILFMKKLTPVYVCFKFKEWVDKHPRGEILNIIGRTDELTHFYEYQLVCNNLTKSLKVFNINVKKRLSAQEDIINVIKKKYNVCDRRSHFIFTLDNNDTRDFDDAIGLVSTSTGHILSVYITNVAIWMETYNLWNSFSQRVSTIYLPDQKLPMLPNILTDCLCSLKKGEERFAFTMDIHITNDWHISYVTFCNTLINVRENLTYTNCHHLPEFRQAMTVVKSIAPSVTTNRDMVSHLMVFMNHHASCVMLKYKNGIYRNVKEVAKDMPAAKDMPEDVSNYLTKYRHSAGEYVTFNDVTYHNHLQLDSYLHITSPIRRVVDLVNLIQLQTNLGLMVFGVDANIFMFNQICHLDQINTSMKAIRKVQNICNVMSLFQGDFQDDIYEGYVFDRVVKDDDKVQYSIYFPQIKYTGKLVCSEEFREHSKHYFELFMFKDEFNVNKKIKVQICEHFTK